MYWKNIDELPIEPFQKNRKKSYTSTETFWKLR